MQQAIAWLNQAFANQGYYDQGSGADAGIQFCLAQRTPDGSATGGITRDQNALTEFTAETQEGAMKNINRWKPKDYINIWVVRDICSTTYGCGIVAYAYYPSYHGNNLDGIVVEASFLNSASNVSALAHEMGHYLGLYHTFEGGCTNNDCLLNGDKVCDTPPDQSTAAVPCNQTVNTCSTDAQSGFATDQPDMTRNHMDYGHIDCKHDFTPGQADRMNYFLNGARKSLLDSKGCLPPCPLPTLAAFTPGDTTINAGQTLFFNNNSQNAVNFSWTLNGIPFGGQQNAAYLFDSAGVFTVQLTAQPLNAQLCEASSAQVTVQVLCEVTADFSVSDINPIENESVIITNASQNATQYEWFVNDVSQGAVLDSVVFDSAGIYILRLQVSNTWCQDETQVILSVRDSCLNPGFQFSIKKGTSSEVNTNTGRIAVLPDGSAVCGSNIYHSTYKKQVLFSKFAANGDVLWSKVYGDSTRNAYVFALQPTPDGGFAAVTLLGAYLSLQYSGVMKFSQDGQLLWYHYLTGSLSETYTFLDLVCNPDGSMAACGFVSTEDVSHPIVVKFDSNGDVLWENRYQATPGSWRTALSLAGTPDNGYIVAGYTSDTNNPDALIFKLNANGTIVWNKILASVHKDFPRKVKVLADGNILLAGSVVDAGSDQLSLGSLAKLSPDGLLLWSKRILFSDNTESVLMDFEESPGEYFTAVGILNENNTPVANASGAIFRFDSTGQFQWVQQYDNIQDGYFIDMAVAPGSSFYIMGNDIFDQSNIWRARLIKADAGGFTGECHPKVLIPQTEDFSMSVFNVTYTLQPLPPIDSAVLPVFDVTLELDTLCAPECHASAERCNNNLDDDEDGLFDCLDPDCNCPEDVCAPEQANIWYFGDHAGLDFSTEPPTVLTDGQSNYELASAAACDANGRLLFYSDTKNVYNRFHQTMPNGTGLTGAQEDNESIIVPHPGDKRLYYLFVSGLKSLNYSVRYSLVDMSLDSGRGDIVPGKKNVQITTFSERRIAAVWSCSFDGYWVLTYLSGAFSAFRIDQNGLNAIPVNSFVGILGGMQFGEMKCSPEGKHIALSLPEQNAIELYDFDQTSGIVSNSRLLTLKGIEKADPYGVEFSPGGRYLYVTTLGMQNDTSHMVQFDLEAGSDFDIVNSIIILASRQYAPDYVSFGNLHTAPNHKIYVANGKPDWGAFTNTLNIIHNPDAPGSACQFQENALALAPATGASFGLCNFISSYFAKPYISFPHDAPDTICQLNSTISYQIKNVQCNVDSLAWRLEGLPGTVQPNGETANIIYPSPGEGRLIVTAYSPCGIVADTLPVVVAEPFDKTLDLGPDRTVCDNGVFTFNAGSGFAHYRWQNGSPDSVLTTLLPGQYWVDVWDACGNLQTDTVTVSIAPATVLDLGPDREGCPDLTASFQRPVFFSRWQWTPGDFISCDTCAGIAVAPASTTSWVVVAQTDDGCISVDTLTFHIRDTLFFQLDTSVCFGQTIDLFGVSLPADTTAQFFFPAAGPGCDTLLTVNVLGLDAPVSELDVQVCPGQLFDFSGSLLPADTTATFLFPGAGSTCDSVVIVHVSAYPPLTVTLPPDTMLRVGATLALKAETSGTGVLNFAWSPPEGLSCADCPDPVAAPLETTLYSISVADANGCFAQDSILINVDSDCVVIIPNAFTPNGDGVNDRFYPKTDPCVRMVRAWRVVSRWGETVFERFNFLPNDPAQGWDGNRTNGEPFPSDVLVWYAEMEYYDGTKVVRKGDVALLR